MTSSSERLAPAAGDLHHEARAGRLAEGLEGLELRRVQERGVVLALRDEVAHQLALELVQLLSA
jgi:hypothetical protein